METKLRSAFALCQTSGQSELQGVSQHSDSDDVVVTLNRNMVSRYKIADQRPISSWSSKDGFEGPAVFDAQKQKYVGLLNRNQIRMWSEEDSKTDNLKKFMFNSKIWRLMSGPDCQTFIVFESGHILPLDHALKSRKEVTENILDSAGALQECYFVKVGDKLFAIAITEHKVDSQAVIIYEEQEEAFVQTKRLFLKNSADSHLLGLTLNVFGKQASLVSFWSDGYLYGLPVFEVNNEYSGCGKSLGHVAGVQADQAVALAALSEKHIAVYGADPNEEGATLLLYNSQYRLVQARQRFKLYTKPPLLWGPWEADKIIVAVGNCLMVSTFVLGSETLASMIGIAAKRKNETNTEVQEVSWGTNIAKPEESPFASAPSSIKASLESMAKLGNSEEAISRSLVPKLIENKDVSALMWFLNKLRDIPEAELVMVASFCLQEPEKTFHGLAELALVRNQPQLPVAPGKDEGDVASLPLESPLDGGRRVLLDSVLKKPLNHDRLVPEIRRHLAPQDALLLMQHASARLWNGDPPSEGIESQASILAEWCSCLLDANYQHCLLSMDTQVLRTLTLLSDTVDMELSQIEALRLLESAIKQTLDGRPIPSMHKKDQAYTIETINLY